ncbi:hypothetical protein NBRC10512_005796 [Rhodotorula toruloides]|uniref:Zinc finger, MYND-type domain containing protein n=1 Tax=Rhodotorula toruloides (strain NP11) TaxID=1130832 RepID=M7WL49_RHOT1|nr:zinc finger, MYND-type domain containing protein [Rhodotorula toruloides NP11]EMS18746.1 zinc finger, MYND-type domain containing protein [Rhodotorula toruloides NP11]
MDTQTMGECLVCGEETKNRCSACAKAGIDLFFCSPEHQKFVWYAHRLFCGRGTANPPLLPNLSAEELDSARQRRSNPLFGVSGDEEASRCIIDYLSGSSGPCSPPLQNVACVLAYIRATRWCDPTTDLEELSRRPFPAFIVDHVSKLLWSFTACLTSVGTLPDEIIETSWWSPLFHRLLILSALVEKTLDDCTPKHIEWVAGAYQRLREWLKSGLGTGNASLGRSLDLAMIRTTQLDMLCGAEDPFHSKHRTASTD